MISIIFKNSNDGGFHIDLNKYPNGETIFSITDEMLSKVRKHVSKNEIIYISLYGENMINEIADLAIITNYFKDIFPTIRLVLYIPYLPYSRMDRQIKTYICTLKYFGQIINSLEFEKVISIDIHSDASYKYINNLSNGMNTSIFKTYMPKEEGGYSKCIKNGDFDYIVLPDKGGYNRHKENLNAKMLKGIKFLVGEKIRNFDMGGRIIGYKLTDIIGNTPNKKETEGKTALIVDDLCSKGYTFYYCAKQLKEEFGFKEVYLYVSHCEKSIEKGELLTTDYVDKIFTTNSMIDNINSDKVEIRKILY